VVEYIIGNANANLLQLEEKMKKAKLFLMFLVFLSLVFSLTACTKNRQTAPAEDDNSSLKIYTTFYPLYDFTKKIAGDFAEVESLIPAGVDPHDFEPSLKQVADIYGADIFIYLGESMEPWAAKIAQNLDKQGIKVIEVGKGLIKNNDPHVWLDPVLAKTISERICEGIVSIDREHEKTYKENLVNLSNKFDELDNAFKVLAEKAARKDIVVSHAFLGYVADRYGFNQVAIRGLSTHDEPSLKKMEELKAFCKANGVKYIFDEQGETLEFSTILANEIGAQILALNPLGTLRPEDIQAGKDYFSVMKENLELLNIALVQE